VPHRSSSNNPVAGKQASFRRRYEKLEAHRAALIARLTSLGDARSHPGYAHALKLLNDTFRKSSLTQRMAVLEAAAWLIGVLEKLTSVT
jgi:hypothetical protein